MQEKVNEYKNSIRLENDPLPNPEATPMCTDMNDITMNNILEKNEKTIKTHNNYSFKLKENLQQCLKVMKN